MAGACVLVIDEQERVLMQLRVDNGLWGLPGGALEPRETMEEYYRYPHGDEVYNVVAAYLCKEYEGDLRKEEAEVKELAFFPAQALPMEINPADKPIIRSYLRKILEE